jgi:hypothetical protein
VIATAVTPARGRVIGRRKVVAIPAARVTYTSEVATGVGSVLKTFAAEETPPPLVRLTLQPGDLAFKYDGGQRIRENMWAVAYRGRDFRFSSVRVACVGDGRARLGG